jgi:hypothetical protein
MEAAGTESLVQASRGVNVGKKGNKCDWPHCGDSAIPCFRKRCKASRGWCEQGRSPCRCTRHTPSTVLLCGWLMRGTLCVPWDNASAGSVMIRETNQAIQASDVRNHPPDRTCLNSGLRRGKQKNPSRERAHAHGSGGGLSRPSETFTNLFIVTCRSTGASPLGENSGKVTSRPPWRRRLPAVSSAWRRRPWRRSP